MEPILGDVIKQLTSELMQPDLTEEQKAERIERTALALEQKKKEEERFEQASPGLFGQDQLLSDRLDRVRRLGRYVTPAELELLVRDYLSHEQPDSVLRPRDDGTRTRDAGENCYWMRVTPRLREFVRRGAPRLDDPALVRFLERAPGSDPAGDVRPAGRPRSSRRRARPPPAPACQSDRCFLWRKRRSASARSAG